VLLAEPVLSVSEAAPVNMLILPDMLDELSIVFDVVSNDRSPLLLLKISSGGPIDVARVDVELDIMVGTEMVDPDDVLVGVACLETVVLDTSMLLDIDHGMEIFKDCIIVARELDDSRSLLLLSEEVPGTRDSGIEFLEEAMSWKSPTVVEFISWLVAVLASWRLVWRLALDDAVS
jgi:hypothetical protein